MTVAAHHATLPSGATMPLLGFGTWQLTGDTGLEATRAALQAGYRHLDAATTYGNEQQAGEALSGADEPVFLTTKQPPDRIVDNADVSLVLTGDDMAALDALGT